METYVVGFLFTENKEKVVLIQKKRPEWQKGFWNGPGGHIEKGETAKMAIEREFQEETGIFDLDWTNFITIVYKTAIVWFFKATMNEVIIKAYIHSPTDEEVAIHLVNELPNVIPNLRWLIPMANDPYLEYLPFSNLYDAIQNGILSNT